MKILTRVLLAVTAVVCFTGFVGAQPAQQALVWGAAAHGMQEAVQPHLATAAPCAGDDTRRQPQGTLTGCSSSLTVFVPAEGTEKPHRLDVGTVQQVINLGPRKTVARGLWLRIGEKFTLSWITGPLHGHKFSLTAQWDAGPIRRYKRR